MNMLRQPALLASLALAVMSLLGVGLFAVHMRGYNQGYREAERAFVEAARQLEITAHEARKTAQETIRPMVLDGTVNDQLDRLCKADPSCNL